MVAFPFWLDAFAGTLAAVEPEDHDLVQAVCAGDTASFEVLIRKYQPRIFATVRRYARREEEIEDIVQEIFIKAYHKLGTFRGDAPFEHWLMRLAVRTCYDFLRAHRRNRELRFSDLSEAEDDWLERFVAEPGHPPEDADAARALVQRLLDMLSPKARLIINLLEIEERSVKEIAELTGWSVPLVKVRAFRARAEMRKCLQRLRPEKYV
jgi:RNA polymerase sigma-70 factor, ECF subfamily